MRVSRDIVGLLVLLLVFTVGGLLLAGRDNGHARRVGREDVPNPSVFNDRASGSRACFAWTRALGYRPVVWRQGWSNLSRSGGQALMVIDPRTQNALPPLSGDEDEGGDGDSNTGAAHDPSVLTPADAAVLLAWLRAGHTAIFCTSRVPGGDKTFGGALDVVVETAARSGRVEFAPLQPVPETAGVLSLHSRSRTRVRRAAPDGVALFGDGDGPFALDVPVGAGRLVVIADGRFASNRSLPVSENALFLAHLLARAAPAGGTVLFDEFHHGDAQAGDGGLWGALGRPLQLTLTQLALAFAVLLIGLAVRFGAPVPLTRTAGRVSSEYVASLAGLYRRAGASGIALETVYRQFLRDMTGRLALAPDVSLEQLAIVAGRRGGVNSDTLRALLADCEERLDKKTVTDADLLELTRRMEQMRKDMDIG